MYSKIWDWIVQQRGTQLMFRPKLCLTFGAQAFLLANLGLDTGMVLLSLFHASCSQLQPRIQVFGLWVDVPHWNILGCPKIGLPPFLSSIAMGFSIINHPAIGCEISWFLWCWRWGYQEVVLAVPPAMALYMPWPKLWDHASYRWIYNFT